MTAVTLFGGILRSIPFRTQVDPNPAFRPLVSNLGCSPEKLSGANSADAPSAWNSSLVSNCHYHLDFSPDSRKLAANKKLHGKVQAKHEDDQQKGTAPGVGVPILIRRETVVEDQVRK